MRLVRLLTVTALAMFVFGAVGTAAASAEEDPMSPAILCLVAKCAKELEIALVGTKAGRIEPLKSAKFIEFETAEMLVQKCDTITGTEERDTNLCKDQSIRFTGARLAEGKEKEKAINCNTEGDAAGILLLLFDLHLASEITSAKVLQAILLAKVLNAKLEALPVVIDCGAIVKAQIKGTFGCLLLPALKNVATTEELEFLCKVKEKDPETGTCLQLCEWLKETPFEMNIGGGFEDAWMLLHLKGHPNKDIFIDD